jgi:hypothetical protein
LDVFVKVKKGSEEITDYPATSVILNLKEVEVLGLT